jgi:hypothetical protein
MQNSSFTTRDVSGSAGGTDLECSRLDRWRSALCGAFYRWMFSGPARSYPGWCRPLQLRAQHALCAAREHTMHLGMSSKLSKAAHARRALMLLSAPDDGHCNSLRCAVRVVRARLRRAIDAARALLRPAPRRGSLPNTGQAGAYGSVIPARLLRLVARVACARAPRDRRRACVGKRQSGSLGYKVERPRLDSDGCALLAQRMAA